MHRNAFWVLQLLQWLRIFCFTLYFPLIPIHYSCFYCLSRFLPSSPPHRRFLHLFPIGNSPINLHNNLWQTKTQCKAEWIFICPVVVVVATAVLLYNIHYIENGFAFDELLLIYSKSNIVWTIFKSYAIHIHNIIIWILCIILFASQFWMAMLIFFLWLPGIVRIEWQIFQPRAIRSKVIVYLHIWISPNSTVSKCWSGQRWSSEIGTFQLISLTSSYYIINETL